MNDLAFYVDCRRLEGFEKEVRGSQVRLAAHCPGSRESFFASGIGLLVSAGFSVLLHRRGHGRSREAA